MNLPTAELQLLQHYGMPITILLKTRLNIMALPLNRAMEINGKIQCISVLMRIKMETVMGMNLNLFHVQKISSFFLQMDSGIMVVEDPLVQ